MRVEERENGSQINLEFISLHLVLLMSHFSFIEAKQAVLQRLFFFPTSLIECLSNI